VYSGGPNNNQLYSTNLTGGNVQKFGAPIPGFADEIYVSSSLGQGGFAKGDIYAGSQDASTIVHISNNGSTQSTFVSSGISGGVRSIAFDPYGLYGNQMIVATNTGNIYTVNSAGVPTLLANVGEDAEGLSFAPQAFGPYAKGTLIVASEGSGTLRAITPGGTKTTVTTIGSAEMVSFVPLNLGSSGNPVEGFYAADFAVQIIKADASQFASYLGDMIVTGETTHQVWDVHFDLSCNCFVDTLIGTFPDQPEDGIFVTSDLISIVGSTPIPAALPLFATGLGALGLLGWRRKKKATALSV
jgi:hypothetical protein